MTKRNNFALGNQNDKTPGHMAGVVEAACRSDARHFLQHGPVRVLVEEGKTLKAPRLVPLFKGQFGKIGKR